MNAQVYHWVDGSHDDRIADWLSTQDGAFAVDGPTTLGNRPGCAIWSGAATVVSTSCCRSAALARVPRPIGGKLLDQLGIRFILRGAMQVGQGSDQRLAQAGE